jgi:hypothetical protein
MTTNQPARPRSRNTKDDIDDLRRRIRELRATNKRRVEVLKVLDASLLDLDRDKQNAAD